VLSRDIHHTNVCETRVREREFEKLPTLQDSSYCQTIREVQQFAIEELRVRQSVAGEKPSAEEDSEGS
jgi:hypothetical protein